MKIADISSSGIFDTAIAFPMQKKTPPRVTDQYELEFVISCEGISVIDGVRRKLEPQTLLVVRPGQRRMTELRFKCYFLHISPELPDEYRELLDSCPTCMRLIDSGIYRDLFEALTRHLITEEGGAESDYTSAKLLELFYYIKRDAERNRSTPEERSPRVNSVIADSIDFMNRNFATDINLGTLAATADYSPNHFHRLFRECTGETPQKYLLGIRIRHAKYMLAGCESSLSEVAYACGFSSQAYFGSIFKRAVGLTPGEYRRFCMSSYNES